MSQSVDRSWLNKSVIYPGTKPQPVTRNDEDGVSRVSATTQLLSDSSDVTMVTNLMTSQALSFLGYMVSRLPVVK